MTDQKIPDKEILNKELPQKRLRKKNHRKENSHMSKQSAPPICKHPDHVTSYFSMQKGILAVITVSGLIYNLGLMARPWFEGQMIQCLFFIQKGQSHFFRYAETGICLFYCHFLRFRSPRFIKNVCMCAASPTISTAVWNRRIITTWSIRIPAIWKCQYRKCHDKSFIRRRRMFRRDP